MSSSTSNLPIVNIKTLIPLELTDSTYLVWKQVFLNVLESFDVTKHVDGTSVVPSQTIDTADKKEVINPEYVSWKKNDTTILSWINATLSLSILHMVVSSSPKTAYDAWRIIEAYFLDKTASTAFSLKSELRSIKKGSMSMSDYMQKIKTIGNALQAIGEIESDHNLVMTVLLGLPEEYRGFVSALNTHRNKPTFEQLRPLLMQEETEVQRRTSVTTSSAIPTIDSEALYANRGRGNRGGRGGRYRGGRGQRGRHYSGRGSPEIYPQSQPNYPQQSYTPNQQPYIPKSGIQCQICGKFNHSALQCRQRFNHSFAADEVPQTFAAMNLHEPGEEVWYPDTGASNHITANSGQGNREGASSMS
ncbi:uncharacterized protein LOC109719366 [Ananas comosus]|uniref:Uncharacterized protein LOC109713693 n=2 Tax=Ananas comosus TaxID=4615 RepID=A0A6P5FBZ2_ANACO|nr:uncharacterized protein LOC109713693 [Ananas comosus]XP_020101567.1 uncharacterized protein LOC109719356 [Ananas comosus]XP_020101576.1 uncharacterized protein LOC109719366 [Ananas comosus]